MIEQIVFGTRGSPLALNQTNRVIEKLKVLYPHLSYKRKIIETQGARDQDTSLTLTEELGLFSNEIQSELVKKNIDAAVHSLKDVPVEFSKKLFLAAIPERVDAQDVLYHPEGLGINDLPTGSVVGTCSLRRRGQIRNLRKDIVIKDIRGNIQTRIDKVHSREYNSIILAAAGLIRLGHDISRYYAFNFDEYATVACDEGTDDCSGETGDNCCCILFDTYYVSPSGDDENNNGGSPDNAFQTIRRAVYEAQEYSTIIVFPATYNEDETIVVDKDLQIYSLYHETGDEVYIETTKIGPAEEGGSVIRFENVSDFTKFYGFTIKGGSAGENNGGGIHLLDSDPHLKRLIIRDNNANSGGGIYCDSSSHLIEYVTLTENEVFKIAKNAVKGIKAGMGPQFIEYSTYRWLEHCGPYFDNDIGYRTEEEFQEWIEKDPIRFCEREILELSDSDIKKYHNEAGTIVKDAFEFAKNSSFPNQDEAFVDLFSN